MELHHLRSFAAVARTGNLTRASEILNLSQPALSAQIKALESELGVTLFERTGRGMEITDHGKLLLERAEGVMIGAGELVAVARELAGGRAGVLRIGLNTDAEVLRVAALSADLAGTAPDVRLELVQGVTSSIVEGVAARILDAGFVYGPDGRMGLASRKLGSAKFVVVAPRSWSRRLSRAGLKQILGEPWIWPPDDCPFYAVTADLFRRSGLSPKRAITVDHEATILSLVRAEVGLSLLPADMVRRGAGDSAVVELHETDSEIGLFFVYRAEAERDSLMRTVLGALGRVWGGLAEPASGVPQQPA